MVPAGSHPRAIRLGPARGIKMNLDLRHRTQLYLGLYERELYAPLTAQLREAEVAVDIGAHDGFYSLIFTKNKNISDIFCIEASASYLDQLRSNLELNGLQHDPRIHLLQSYVSYGSEQGTRSLDDIVGTAPRRTFVKMDVEGSELDILRGALRLHSQQRTSWLIETHSKMLEEQCISFLAERGYSTRIIPNARFRILVPESRSEVHNRWLLAIPHPLVK